MKEALKLALEALKMNPLDTPTDVYDTKYQKAIDVAEEALAQPEQDNRQLQIAMRQWDDWKTYALELQKKLVKYEGGSPMLLNAQTERPWVGLTGQEKALVASVSLDVHDAVHRTEAKLKAVYGFHSTEKNT